MKEVICLHVWDVSGLFADLKFYTSALLSG